VAAATTATIPARERERPFLSVVVPAYRAGAVLRPTIDAVERHAVTRRWELEVIVVTSGGDERTSAIAREAARDYQDVVVLDARANVGKGGALKLGMRAARGTVCCFIDADNAVPFDQIDVALPLLDDSDVAIASRYMVGAEPGKRRLARRVLSRGGNLLIKLLLGLPYTDTRAPLKVFRSDAAKELFERIRLRGFGFDSELLFLAGRYGYRVTEFPVRFHEDGESTVRVPTAAVSSIIELLQVRWYWLRGRYRR
jgi:dolichyl-phosphate beta-glucosyltransferase